jgi:hypothetical protein
MERLNRNQALWLARGVALGGFLLRLIRAVHAGVGHLRDIGFARRRLPKRPRAPSRSSIGKRTRSGTRGSGLTAIWK